MIFNFFQSNKISQLDFFISDEIIFNVVDFHDPLGQINQYTLHFWMLIFILSKALKSQKFLQRFFISKIFP